MVGITLVTLSTDVKNRRFCRNIFLDFSMNFGVK